MENVVDNLMEDILSDYDEICQCERCKSDIKAITLNNLKPHYVATEKGELYSKVNEMSNQFKVDVYKALTDAVEIVKKNPHHKQK
jgi:competence protein ComFB